MLNPIKTYIAKRNLAKHLARQKELMADYTSRRNAQLSLERKQRVKTLVGDKDDFLGLQEQRKARLNADMSFIEAMYS